MDAVVVTVDGERLAKAIIRGIKRESRRRLRLPHKPNQPHGKAI